MVFAPAVSFAASPAGWAATAADTVMAGATATITAFKGTGSNAMKAVVAHKPTAVAVGKELVKGGGALALAYAMSKLLDAGIDWVLDPENNRVKYNTPAVDGSALEDDQKCLIFAINTYGVDSVFTQEVTASAGVCYARVNGRSTNIGNMPGDGYFDSEPQEKYIPIETVAQEVLEGAEAAHPASQEFVRDVALGEVESGSLDPALEAVAEPTTDTPNPDAPPTDPAEPFDPTSIIDAIKKIGAILGGLIAAVTNISDMFSDSPSNAEDTEVPIDDAPPVRAPTEFDTEYVNFGGQCPSFGSHDISVGSVSVPLTIDITPLCELAELVRPAVIGGAYLVATGLVVAAIREA